MKKKILELLKRLEEVIECIVYIEVCTDYSGGVYRAGGIKLFEFWTEAELIKKLKEAIGEAK